MPRVVSATQARIHFGEIMRHAVERKEPILVERGGRPYVVVLSVEEYNRLQAAQTPPTWEEVLERLRAVRERIHARRRGAPLPPPEEVIREMREERSAQLAHLP